MLDQAAYSGRHLLQLVGLGGAGGGLGGFGGGGFGSVVGRRNINRGRRNRGWSGYTVGGGGPFLGEAGQLVEPQSPGWQRGYGGGVFAGGLGRRLLGRWVAPA